jgi:hypothetical protein
MTVSPCTSKRISSSSAAFDDQRNAVLFVQPIQATDHSVIVLIVTPTTYDYFHFWFSSFNSIFPAP